MGSFYLNQKHILWFFGIYNLPILVETFCHLSFVNNILALGLWIFKQCNFCLAAGHGTSILCPSLPSLAVTLCPLILLKCHQEGPQLIQVKTPAPGAAESSNVVCPLWEKRRTPCSILIFLITFIMHSLKERRLLIHSPQRCPQSISKTVILITIDNFIFTLFYSILPPN